MNHGVAAAAEPPARPRPSPAVAGLLSALALGLGHVYAGRTRRGLAWAGASIACVGVVAAVERVLGGGALMLALFAILVLPWLGALIDAVRVSGRAREARAPLGRVFALGVALFVVARGSTFLVRTFLLEAFKIPSGSMSPTLMVGDHMFVDKTPTTPKLGDVIVFPFPEKRAQDFVKRVVALPGDHIEFKKGVPIVNGVETPRCLVGDWSFVDEGLTHAGSLYVERLGTQRYLAFYDADVTDFPDRQGPWTVAAGEVWVAGDDRLNAYDSRFWFHGAGGGVPISTVRGTALLLWLSQAHDRLVWSRLGASLREPHLPPGAERLAPELAKCMTSLGSL